MFGQIEDFDFFILLFWTGQAGLFFFPAYVANMVPLLVGWIPWKRSIWATKLGPNKTWRGLIAGTLIATVAAMFLYTQAKDSFSEYLLVDYGLVGAAIIGALLGFGALVGDSVESYFKRKKNIPSGEQWKIMDQIDFMIGATLFVAPIVWDKPHLVLLATLVGSGLQPSLSKIAFMIGLKKPTKRITSVETEP